MARRVILALTEAQAHQLRMAIKTRSEDGSGWDNASAARAYKHMDAIERQMKRDYTLEERVAIFEEATRLLKRKQ